MKVVLLFGMVFAEELKPKRGQEFRDRVRSEALESRGYRVLTLDDKHEPSEKGKHAGKHIQTNFVDARRAIRSIRLKWGDDIFFDEVILDYFFSPVGWARERWKDRLFTETIPRFAIDGLLKEGGIFVLPYLDNVRDQLDVFNDRITQYYTISYMIDPAENSLYKATEDVTETLLLAPDVLTNQTQIEPLLIFSQTPFVVLTRKSDADILVASVHKKRSSFEADLD